MTYNPYTIRHEPSGDEAEAESRDAAIVAARTLLEDNEFAGSCRIFRGEDVLDVVWADDSDHYTHLQQ
jgi:hypothetical protein